MPESDDATLAFYDAEAASYADAFNQEQEHSKYILHFMAELTPGGSTCDLGSGDGWAAARMRDAGFRVTAIDGSAGLAAEARKRYNVDVTVMRFEDYAFVDAFDGVWAAWSLHHAHRDAFPELLGRVGRSLKSGGVLFLAMKGGSGEKRDRLDRLYAYYEMNELKQHINERVGGEILLADSFEGAGFEGSVTPLHVLLVKKAAP